MKYGSLHARVTYCPQSLSKIMENLILNRLNPCLNVFRELTDINFPLEIHAVISFMLDETASLKQLTCLEFLWFILSNPKVMV